MRSLKVASTAFRSAASLPAWRYRTNAAERLDGTTRMIGHRTLGTEDGNTRIRVGLLNTMGGRSLHRRAGRSGIRNRAEEIQIEVNCRIL
jgi:hypothetical protein